MKTTSIVIFTACVFFTLKARAAGGGSPITEWLSKEAPLMTRWAKDVNPENAHPEYPRPQMVRGDWMSLNGIWEFGIGTRNETELGIFNRNILVPFPVESAFSGIRQRVGESDRLWYRRKFAVPESWEGKRVLLHFDAVDWETRVWLNEKELGSHQGGYDRFSFDITDALEEENELVLSVWDPAENWFQPRGKQKFGPHYTYYTGAAGIWQSVWLEPVPETSVRSLKLVPDIDGGLLKIAAEVTGNSDGISVEAIVRDGDREIASGDGPPTSPFNLEIPDAKLWSPDSPHLYDLKITLKKNGQSIDTVESYFGMRKISVEKERGFPRLMLNNQRLFQIGVLDEGYWPDGIYTAPTDEALKWDIEQIKELGFNMVRKHMKVAPERWYYWCDRMGLLVWQDMPNGDATGRVDEIERSDESAAQFEKELQAMVEGRFNHPSIVTWIIFNQGWGQYDTVRLTEEVKQMDPSRLVMGVSGYYDKGGGDVRSLHNYRGPQPPVHDGVRPMVMGESGGFGLKVDNHLWEDYGSWGHVNKKSAEDLYEAYFELFTVFAEQVRAQGLAGIVFTQWTDVEQEVTGLYTYDREQLKLPDSIVRSLNYLLIDTVPLTEAELAVLPQDPAPDHLHEDATTSGN